MPDLDVSEVLDDPMFQDQFIVISSSRTINANGVAVDSGPTYNPPCFGVIIPNKSTLQRLDDGSRLAASIDVYTRTNLTAGYKFDDVKSFNADILVWKNRKYVVSGVEDWSDYGCGFYHVSADLTQVNYGSK